MARKKKKNNTVTSGDRWMDERINNLALRIDRRLAQQRVIERQSSIRSEGVGPAVLPGPPFSNCEAEMAQLNKSLVQGIAKLFNNPKHADMKIYIGGYELPAHALVLASRSLYFEKALGENFREGQTKQFHFEEKGRMHAHWRVFEYMYTGDYLEDAAQELAGQDDDELVKDVRVYVTADYFLMEDLKQHALSRFKSKLRQLWVSDHIVDCIREIYMTTVGTEHELRNAVADIAKEHRSELWKKNAIRDLVHNGGDFAVELMGKLCSDRY